MGPSATVPATSHDVRAPKPQVWTREYSGGQVMRIQTHSAGRWRVSGDDAVNVPVSPTSSLQTIQSLADARARGPAVGPWRRLCQRCDAVMALGLRARPDSGPQFARDYLWLCPESSCGHAEPADD